MLGQVFCVAAYTRMMAGEDDDHLSGRELAVIWTTAILAGFALVFGLVGRAALMDCRGIADVEEWPSFVGLALGVLCIVPLVLAVAWRLRRAIWVSALLAFLLTPVIVSALLASAGSCPG